MSDHQVAPGRLIDLPARVTELCLALPEANVSGEQHLRFSVGRRTFAYFLDNHHDDGRVALNVKVEPVDLDLLVSLDPDGSDWARAAKLIKDSYRKVAPRRLASLV